MSTDKSGEMMVRFWGVRGSIAVPGEDTRYIGGNTSCVEVRCGDARFILDSGTGIRGLGAALAKEGVDETTLLLSHLHWDHIQGFPFYAPLYSSAHRLRVLGGGTPELGVRDALSLQMKPPTFPVLFDELPCRIESRTVRHGLSIDHEGVEIQCAKLNHPGGGVFAYRLNYAGKSVVYATDTEHYGCVDPTLRRLAMNADVLIYDSQYTPGEYCGDEGPARTGWGHSTFEAGAALAHAAEVSRYVLFHHDPARDDDGVLAIEERAQGLFERATAAREGLSIDVRRDGEYMTGAAA